MSDSTQITVFYDGLCRVCSWEIEKYRRLDSQGRISFVDIEAPGFDAAALGLNSSEVRRVLHVRTAEGKLLTGVDSFVAIWRVLDRPTFRAMVAAAETPLARPVLELGYRAFVRVRPWLPRKKAARCETDRCSYQGEKTA